MSNITNNGGGNKDYNMILEQARGATETASSFSTEAPPRINPSSQSISSLVEGRFCRLSLLRSS